MRNDNRPDGASLRSRASFRSILSLFSALSTLSILSIGSAGGILCIGNQPILKRGVERRERPT
jgi:hypothetical protein